MTIKHGAELLPDVEVDQSMTIEGFWEDVNKLFRRVPWHVWNRMDLCDKFAYDDFVINLIRRERLKAERKCPKGHKEVGEDSA